MVMFVCRWSKGEQSTALATATNSGLQVSFYALNLNLNLNQTLFQFVALVIGFIGWYFQELSEWNARYKEKFGFVFLICASGRSAGEILDELKVNVF